jgi:hypothetical protein
METSIKGSIWSIEQRISREETVTTGQQSAGKTNMKDRHHDYPQVLELIPVISTGAIKEKRILY